jgi:hypothetical protein
LLPSFTPTEEVHRRLAAGDLDTEIVELNSETTAVGVTGVPVAQPLAVYRRGCLGQYGWCRGRPNVHGAARAWRPAARGRPRGRQQWSVCG